MWAQIKDDAESSGIEGVTRWSEMDKKFGGDLPEKAVDVFLTY